MIFQFGTSNWGGRRKLIHAFTEQGAAMLSSVLNSDQDIMVNIQVMRVFFKIHEMLMYNLDVRLEVEEMKKNLIFVLSCNAVKLISI
jgi:hypothetical protein